jgi:hypothetical protein
MIKIRESSFADNDWNKRLIESGFGTIYQSKEQGDHHIRQGRIPIYLQFFNEQQIIGQLLAGTVSRFRQNNLKSSFLKKIPILKQMSCYWTYGPIIFDKNLSNEIYLSLGNYLKEKKYVASGWQNPLCSYKINNSETNFSTKPWSTFIIDLTQSKEHIFNLIDKHSGRKNIQRSIKRGVEIKQINDKNFVEYAKLRIIESNEPITNSLLENKIRWWKSVKQLGYSGFLAIKDQKAIGGILFSSFGGHIIEVGIARSKEDTINHLFSQDLLKWKIIEWGIENKMNYYNLAGFNPTPESIKEKGIFRYKKKWGGKRYDFYRLFFK